MDKAEEEKLMADQTLTETNKFNAWWRNDPERAKCTLEQAIGAYLSTYPGRTSALLCELLHHLNR